MTSPLLYCSILVLIHCPRVLRIAGLTLPAESAEAPNYREQSYVSIGIGSNQKQEGCIHQINSGDHGPYIQLPSKHSGQNTGKVHGHVSLGVHALWAPPSSKSCGKSFFVMDC